MFLFRSRICDKDPSSPLRTSPSAEGMSEGKYRKYNPDNNSSNSIGSNSNNAPELPPHQRRLSNPPAPASPINSLETPPHRRVSSPSICHTPNVKPASSTNGFGSDLKTPEFAPKRESPATIAAKGNTNA